MSEHQAHPRPPAGDHGEDLDRIAGDLEAVDAAMRRLDEGTYGLCAQCGRPIPEDTLTNDPLAASCAEHAASAPA